MPSTLSCVQALLHFFCYAFKSTTNDDDQRRRMKWCGHDEERRKDYKNLLAWHSDDLSLISSQCWMLCRVVVGVKRSERDDNARTIIKPSIPWWTWIVCILMLMTMRKKNWWDEEKHWTADDWILSHSIISKNSANMFERMLSKWWWRCEEKNRSRMHAEYFKVSLKTLFLHPAAKTAIVNIVKSGHKICEWRLSDFVDCRWKFCNFCFRKIFNWMDFCEIWKSSSFVIKFQRWPKLNLNIFKYFRWFSNIK